MIRKFMSALAGEPAPIPHSEQKGQATPLIALELERQVQWTPHNYAGFSKQAYQRNPIAYRCIRLVSDIAASVPLIATDRVSNQSYTDVQKVLEAGAPGMTATDMFETFYGYLQLGGNAFLEASLLGDMPHALYALRPDRVRIKTAKNGWPCAYIYSAGEHQKTYLCDQLSGKSHLFHLRSFHPTHDTLGLSPLASASQAIDIHNTGGQWTKSLLDNSARPSGALVYRAGESGQYLDKDQFDRLKTELETAYSGARHAGRPMVLEGGLDWKPMSLSPADMDFLNARRDAAREIALALGVPPMLLGIPGIILTLITKRLIKLSCAKLSGHWLKKLRVDSAIGCALGMVKTL